MRSRLDVFPVVLLLLATLASSTSGQQKSSTPPISNEHEPLRVLPESVLGAELRSLRGRPFRLADYSGKVVVLNLWATWVSPSRLETPELMKLHKQFRSRGVEVIGLSTEEPKASKRAVRRWVRQFGVDYMIGWAPPDVSLTLMDGRDALPQTLVISRSGRILKRVVGFNVSNTPLLFKEAVEEALKEESNFVP